MSNINKIRYNNEDYDINTDSLPIGTIVEYDGTIVPDGYEEVEDKGEIYSTEEQIVGTWIDGKPIYKKTINFTTTAVGKHTITHNISDLENVIKVEGFSKYSTTFYILPMSSAFDNVTAYSISIQDIGLKALDFFVGTAIKGTVVTYLTMYYTKTTD